MQQKEKAKSPTTNRRITALVIIAVIVVGIIAALFFLGQPERSVTAYCKAYAEEKARLAKLPGDTYPSGVFSDELSDASEFAKAFEKLEKVAPDEIRPDVKNLKGIYKKMADDPSQAIAASLSGASVEESVKKWTDSRCEE